MITAQRARVHYFREAHSLKRVTKSADANDGSSGGDDSVSCNGAHPSFNEANLWTRRDMTRNMPDAVRPLVVPFVVSTLRGRSSKSWGVSLLSGVIRCVRGSSTKSYLPRRYALKSNGNSSGPFRKYLPYLVLAPIP